MNLFKMITPWSSGPSHTKEELLSLPRYFQGKPVTFPPGASFSIPSPSHVPPSWWYGWPVELQTVKGTTLAETGVLIDDKKQIHLESTHGRKDVLEESLDKYDENTPTKTQVSYAENPAVSLCTYWSKNYFHFMTEVLPRVGLMEAAEIRPQAIYIHPSAPTFVEQALEILAETHLCLKCDILRLDTHVRADHWLLFPPTRVKGEFCPAAARWMRGAFVSSPPRTLHRKLWISRKNSRTPLVDEDRVVEQLFPDYEIVVAENFDLKQQIELFSQASHVAGAHGAGLTNIIFSRDTSLTEICMPNAGDTYQRLCNTLGMEYQKIAATEANEVDWSQI